MKRRGFFGALLAAFFPAVPATADDLWAEGTITWASGPVYQSTLDRVQGRYIWVSPIRTIHSPVRWDGSTFEPFGRG